jgi:hypothetical protein
VLTGTFCLAFIFISISDLPSFSFAFFNLVLFFLLQYPLFVSALGFTFQFQFQLERVLDGKPVKQITETGRNVETRYA